MLASFIIDKLHSLMAEKVLLSCLAIAIDMLECRGLLEAKTE